MQRERLGSQKTKAARKLNTCSWRTQKIQEEDVRGGQNSINKTDSPFPFPDHLSFHYILLLSSWLPVLSSSLPLAIVENGSFKNYQLSFAQGWEPD